MENLFIMTVGVPGSGKSTYFKKMKDKENWVHISSDDIREELFGSAQNQEHNQEVFQEMRKRSAEAIRQNKNVYYDATNINRKKRRNFLKDMKIIALSHSYSFECILFAVPAQICKERNFIRERKVPENVIERMVKQFQVPTFSEGWDNIIRLAPAARTGILEKKLKEACFLFHDNPHHKLSIGDHMIKAYEIGVQTNGEALQYHLKTRYSREVLEAARYHDIGKPECKVFCNWRGEPTKIAHFYSHDNVSAYNYLCYVTDFYDNLKGGPVFSKEKALYIALLIECHMKHYNNDFDNWCKKQHDPHFIADLNLLYELDKAAH